MAQLNRPLSEGEIEKLLMTTPTALFHTNIFDAIYEDRHDTVSYVASSGRVQYQTPEFFYWSHVDTSPSDCVWMIPQTVRPWYKR